MMSKLRIFSSPKILLLVIFSLLSAILVSKSFQAKASDFLIVGYPSTILQRHALHVF